MLKPSEIGEAGPGTTVGANVVLTGTIKDVNDIIVYGRVEGEIICERSVFIGDNAQVKGPITAQIVTVSGKVDGSIDGKEKIELTASGKLIGSLTTKDLIIQSGAVFVGKAEMPDSGESSETTETKDKKKSDDSAEEISATPDKDAPAYEVE